MATQVKHRRGTNAEILAGTAAIAELWFNTTDNSIHMGDGVTVGGIKHVNVKMLPMYLFDSVADMQAGVTSGGVDAVFEQHQTLCTGGTMWRVSTFGGKALSGGLYAFPISDLYLRDYGVVSDDTDKTSEFMEALADSKSTGHYLNMGRETVSISGDNTAPTDVKIRNGRINFLDDSTSLRWNFSSQLEDLRIDAGGSDYAVQEVVTSGSTTGLKYSTLKRIVCTGSAISDFYLKGYHFLMNMEHCYSYSTCSGYGIEIDNVDGIANPDIAMTCCYVNGPNKGYKLDDGSFLLNSCSADNCESTPLAANNSFLTFESCGFEQMRTWMSISSSSAYFNNCTASTFIGTFADDGGNKFFVLVGGGTYPGSVYWRGGILLNQSDAEIAAIRALSSSPAATAVLGRDVELRVNTFPITRFIYQSKGSPNINAARLCTYGDSSDNICSSGVDPSGLTAFDIEFSPSSTEYVIPDDVVLRYMTWKEIGSNTAGASTAVSLQIYTKDGTLRKTVSNVISIPGSTSGSAKRYGSKIIDEDMVGGEYIKFVVSTAGQRANTGFTITATFNS